MRTVTPAHEADRVARAGAGANAAVDPQCARLVAPAVVRPVGDAGLDAVRHRLHPGDAYGAARVRSSICSHSSVNATLVASFHSRSRS